MHKLRKWLMSMLAPTVCQIGDVILTRRGEAYYVANPGNLRQMRVVRWSQIRDMDK